MFLWNQQAAYRVLRVNILHVCSFSLYLLFSLLPFVKRYDQKYNLYKLFYWFQIVYKQSGKFRFVPIEPNILF